MHLTDWVWMLECNSVCVTQVVCQHSVLLHMFNKTFLVWIKAYCTGTSAFTNFYPCWQRGLRYDSVGQSVHHSEISQQLLDVLPWIFYRHLYRHSPDYLLNWWSSDFSSTTVFIYPMKYLKNVLAGLTQNLLQTFVVPRRCILLTLL